MEDTTSQITNAVKESENRVIEKTYLHIIEQARSKANENRKKLLIGVENNCSLRLHVIDFDQLSKIRSIRQEIEVLDMKLQAIIANYNFEMTEIMEENKFSVSNSQICLECGTIRTGGTKEEQEQCPVCK